MGTDTVFYHFATALLAGLLFIGRIESENMKQMRLTTGKRCDTIQGIITTHTEGDNR